MTFVILILVFLLALTLYEYFGSKDLHHISEIAAKANGMKYGGYKIQQYSAYILSATLVILLVLMVLSTTVYTNMVFVGNVMDQTHPEKLKELEIEYTLPTVKEDQKQEELQKLTQKDNFKALTNDVSNENGQVGEQKKVYASADEPAQKHTLSTEEEVYAYERELFANAKGTSERAEIQRQIDETKAKQEAFKKQQQNKAKTSGKTNGTVTSSKKGNTMVSFNLPGRTPHNNNIYYVRNPGYTCEQGATGTVVINIRVNSNGDVTSAVPAASYASLVPCLVDQAVKYAKMSRFNASSKNSESGTITYVFMP